MRKREPMSEGRTAILRFVDESRLYRKIPVIRRLVPSICRKIEKLIWPPHGRSMRITPMKFVGLNASRIHLFGDSHCLIYGMIPEVELHHKASVTMHRVGRDGVDIFLFDTFEVKPGEALGFVFGEIDMRAHVMKQRDRFKRDATEVIETLVARYMATLQNVRKRFPASPIIIFCVVPPMGRKYPNYRRYKIDWHFAPDDDRIKWTKEVNALLRREAAKAGFGYVDQYTPFVNDKGLLNIDMTADGLHLTPNPVGKDVQEIVCVFEGNGGATDADRIPNTSP